MTRKHDDEASYTVEARIGPAAERAKKKGGSDADVREAARAQFGSDVDDDLVQRIKERMNALP